MTGWCGDAIPTDMQQTALDHFLKDRFVYVYEIRVNRLPRRMPEGVSVTPVPRSLKRTWNFLLRCDSHDIYHSTIAYLRGQRMMYDAGIGERDDLVSRLCNPPDQESFTYNSIWASLKLGGSAFLLNFGITAAPALNLNNLYSGLKSLIRR